MKDSSKQMKPTGMGNTYNVGNYISNLPNSGWLSQPPSFGNTFIPKDK